MRLKSLGKAGFTLIEVIVVMVMIGLVMVIALPQFSSMLESASLKSAAREMYGQFQRARMEAVKRNEKIRITFPTTDNTKFSITTESGDTVLGLTSLPKGLIFAEANFSGVNFTTFSPRGEPANQGHVEIKDPSIPRSINVVVSQVGNIRLENKE